MRIWIVFIFICTAMIFISCSTVKPWQRTFLNDPGMQMADSPGKTFEEYVQSIRTGSVVAGSQKSAGGCGCN